jgi:hypothetical protein
VGRAGLGHIREPCSRITICGHRLVGAVSDRR